MVLLNLSLSAFPSPPPEILFLVESIHSETLKYTDNSWFTVFFRSFPHLCLLSIIHCFFVCQVILDCLLNFLNNWLWDSRSCLNAVGNDNFILGLFFFSRHLTWLGHRCSVGCILRSFPLLKFLWSWVYLFHGWTTHWPVCDLGGDLFYRSVFKDNRMLSRSDPCM